MKFFKISNRGITYIVCSIILLTAHIIATGQTGCASNTFVDKNGIVSIEAEHYTTMNGYNELTDLNASGSKAMAISATNGSLNFQVTLSQGGAWYFYFRTYATDDKNNSIKINIDGTRLKAPSDDVNAGQDRMYLGKGGTYTWNSYWQGLVHGGRSWPIRWDATAGTHTISIIKDAANPPKIDKFIIVNNKINISRSASVVLPGYSIPGPAETPCASNVAMNPVLSAYLSSPPLLGPNPFRQHILLNYSLKEKSNVDIKVFNLNGRVVSALFSGLQGPGEKSAVWRPGSHPAGVYMFRINIGQNVWTRKSLLIK
jgi:hypothetical protein